MNSSFLTGCDSKKLLMVMQLPPPFHGHAFMCQLAQHALEGRPDVEVHTIPIRFNADMTKICRFSVLKIGILIRTLFRLTGEMIRWKPHRVYFTPCVTGRWPLLRDMAFVVVIRMFRTPIVHHLHGLGIQECILRRPWMRHWFTFLFRGSDLICLGNIQARDVTGVFDGIPFILPNGIPDFDTEPLLGDHKADDPVRLFYISHLMTAKGILDFVEMLGRLAQDKVRFSADIAGGDGDITREALTRQIEAMGLASQVRIHGQVHGEAKDALFNAANIYVFPSRFQESFGLVLLEAMRSGLPVVAASVGGVPGIVDEGITGKLYPSGDVGKLTQSVRELMLDANLRRRMGQAGRERFLLKFTDKRFEQGLYSIFQSVCL